MWRSNTCIVRVIKTSVKFVTYFIHMWPVSAVSLYTHNVVQTLFNSSMAPESRSRVASLSLKSFDLAQPITPAEATPRALEIGRPSASSSSSTYGDEEKEGGEEEDEEEEEEEEEEDDSGPQSQYTLDDESSEESSDGESDNGNEAPSQTPFLHHSNSSLLMSNAFAPPYYNRPPTPLPASPSLTSLLRPPFSTTTSRPTTPDSSENDTPNDTEAAVAKSARIATTVPRASPKVPTYEYYGFVLYLLSSLGFRKSTSLAHRPLAYSPSHVPPLVLSPLTLPSPTRYLLLSESLVVSCNTFFSRHDSRLHLCCFSFLQYRLLDSAHEQYREYCR